MNIFDETTTPAILRCDYEGAPTEWKVSPYGPSKPDEGATWHDSQEFAHYTAHRILMEPVFELEALKRELGLIIEDLQHMERKTSSQAIVSGLLLALRNAEMRGISDACAQLHLDGVEEPRG